MSKLSQQRALQEVCRRVYNQLCSSRTILAGECWVVRENSLFDRGNDDLLQRMDREIQKTMEELMEAERLCQGVKEELESQQQEVQESDSEQQDLEYSRRQLEEWEQKLEQREKQTRQKEDALERRQQRLDAWEATLQREAAVRQDRKTALTSLREIQGAMMEVQRQVRQLGPTFRDITEHINGGFAIGGLKDLIRCSRSLYQLGSDEAKYYAAELEQILANDFGCEKIQPVIGQPLDLLTMSKVDADDLGQQVKEILYTGWRMGETVLEKAVVAVMEG